MHFEEGVFVCYVQWKDASIRAVLPIHCIVDHADSPNRREKKSLFYWATGGGYILLLVCHFTISIFKAPLSLTNKSLEQVGQDLSTPLILTGFLGTSNYIWYLVPGNACHIIQLLFLHNDFHQGLSFNVLPSWLAGYRINAWCTSLFIFTLDNLDFLITSLFAFAAAALFVGGSRGIGSSDDCSRWSSRIGILSWSSATICRKDTGSCSTQCLSWCLLRRIIRELGWDGRRSRGWARRAHWGTHGGGWQMQIQGRHGRCRGHEGIAWRRWQDLSNGRQPLASRFICRADGAQANRVLGIIALQRHLRWSRGRTRVKAQKTFNGSEFLIVHLYIRSWKRTGYSLRDD